MATVATDLRSTKDSATSKKTSREKTRTRKAAGPENSSSFFFWTVARNSDPQFAFLPMARSHSEFANGRRNMHLEHFILSAQRSIRI